MKRYGRCLVGKRWSGLSCLLNLLVIVGLTRNLIFKVLHKAHTSGLAPTGEYLLP